MKTSDFKKIQAEQARIIGRATILAAYIPTGDDAADTAHIVNAIEEVAIMTRQIDLAIGQGSIEEQAIYCLGGTFCAKALSWSLKSMHKLAILIGVDAEPAVVKAVERVLLARKVLVRRELEHAVESMEDLARAESISVSDLFELRGDVGRALRDGVATSIETAKDAGLSKDFLGRMRSRLGFM
tara:strand:- start:5130 stop:5681 length:552 start_codon:yes stop_codon:yes gene_type:complete